MVIKAHHPWVAQPTATVLSLKLRHNLVAGFKVGRDLLDVIVIFQRIDQLHQLFHAGQVHLGRGGGTPDQLGGFRLAQFRLKRVGHVIEVRIGAPDHVAIVGAFNVFGPCLDRGHHDRIRVADLNRIAHSPLTVEHETHAARLAQVPTVFGKGRAHGGGGPVAVVRHRLDDHGDAIGAIALIADFFVILAVACHGFLDGAVNIILGHRLALGLFDSQTQTRVLVGVRITHLGGDGDLLGQLGKELGPDLVLASLAVLDVRPF
mmetsp:Transcript_23743/g.42542  ORF Transcript_23743/g.42542 Transcript_23743/m.42542 type:complete len:262 (+) Transcript_23743:1304-2089(+)